DEVCCVNIIFNICGGGWGAVGGVVGGGAVDAGAKYCAPTSCGVGWGAVGGAVDAGAMYRVPTSRGAEDYAWLDGQITIARQKLLLNLRNNNFGMLNSCSLFLLSLRRNTSKPRNANYICP
ncbi:MAG: hypothetical protein ACI30K_06850, partial [Muribaculaceae bacterium]